MQGTLCMQDMHHAGAAPLSRASTPSDGVEHAYADPWPGMLLIWGAPKVWLVLAESQQPASSGLQMRIFGVS